MIGDEAGRNLSPRVSSRADWFRVSEKELSTTLIRYNYDFSLVSKIKRNKQAEVATSPVGSVTRSGLVQSVTAPGSPDELISYLN